MKTVTYGMQLLLLLVTVACEKKHDVDNTDMTCRNTDEMIQRFRDGRGDELDDKIDDGSHIVRHRRKEQRCPKVKSGMNNYHVVPWTILPTGGDKDIKTLYNGDKYNMYGVKHIIEAVIDQLGNNYEKRFLLTQTSFFWKWWKDQHDAMRHVVKSLVENGQLEFAGGGWVENDEAVTYYQATIDQMNWGLRRLQDIFGAKGRPYVAWQMEAYGHSRTQANIFAMMGFDALFIDRIDYEERLKMTTKHSLQFCWDASTRNIADASTQFTVASDEEKSQIKDMMEIMDREEVTNSTMDTTAFKEFLVTIGDNYKKTENKLIHMGSELGYSPDSKLFLNLDLLMEGVNKMEPTGGRKKMNIFYSTPACFMKALNSEAKSFSEKKDDFMPYSDPNATYWSGFFTSKPNIKYFERLGNNFLQVSKQLYAMAETGYVEWTDLNRLREAVGNMQQIGVITGTASDAVGLDYVRILHEAMVKSDRGTEGAVQELMSNDWDPVASPIKLESCLLLNISLCPVTESNADFVVTVYNPLGHRSSQYVRVPVIGTAYSVVDPNGVGQDKQFVPIPEAVLTLTGRTNNTYDLVFLARDLPPLGFKSYYIKMSDSDDEIETSNSDSVLAIWKELEDQDLTARDTSVKLDSSGALKSLSMNTITLNLAHSFAYYKTKPVSSTNSMAASIFAPGTDEATPVELTSSKVYRGELVDEVHQVFEENYITQVIRIYQEYNHIEFEWMVGPIPADDMNTEVVSRFETEFTTQGKFYTDSNGRELMERKRRPSVTRKRRSPDIEPISSNYYPVATRIVIRDEEKDYEAAVVTDRGQGGSSLTDGHIELMVHRRTSGTDKPNSKTVDHTLVSRGKHYFIAGTQKGLKPCLQVQERQLVLQTMLKPWMFVSNVPQNMCFDDWKSKFKMEFSGLQKLLPANVHILTLEPWKKNTLLLRLEHFVESCVNTTDGVEDPAQKAIVDLATLFSSFAIKRYRETTLDGNQFLTDSLNLKWTRRPPEPEPKPVPATTTTEASTVEPRDTTIAINPTKVATEALTEETTTEAITEGTTTEVTIEGTTTEPTTEPPTTEPTTEEYQYTTTWYHKKRSIKYEYEFEDFYDEIVEDNINRRMPRRSIELEKETPTQMPSKKTKPVKRAQDTPAASGGDRKKHKSKLISLMPMQIRTFLIEI